MSTTNKHPNQDDIPSQKEVRQQLSPNFCVNSSSTPQFEHAFVGTTITQVYCSTESMLDFDGTIIIIINKVLKKRILQRMEVSMLFTSYLPNLTIDTVKMKSL